MLLARHLLPLQHKTGLLVLWQVRNQSFHIFLLPQKSLERVPLEHTRRDGNRKLEVGQIKQKAKNRRQKTEGKKQKAERRKTITIM